MYYTIYILVLDFLSFLLFSLYYCLTVHIMFCMHYIFSYLWIPGRLAAANVSDNGDPVIKLNIEKLHFQHMLKYVYLFNELHIIHLNTYN